MRVISQIPVSFLFQSYLDSSIGAAAILSQPTNELIVPSTLREYQGEGYVVGVTSSSQTPIAFRFGKETGVIVLRPGESMRVGRFTGFTYGLPFGWLGGGLSVIKIGHAPDVVLDLGSSRPEIIFHRVAFDIKGSADPLTALNRNWPLEFPWTRARRGVTSIDQSGNPTIRVEPTRTLVRLRVQIVAPKVVGLIFRGMREFEEDEFGVVTAGDTDSTFVEIQFQPSTDPAIALYPMTTIPEDFLRLACGEGGLSAVDLGDAELTDASIEFVRFGRI